MTDIVLSLTSKVVEYLVAPIGRHCGYVIFSDSYIRQLNDEVQKLGDTRDEVQYSINEARNNMKPIKTKVETWAKDVETVDHKARDMLEHDGRAKKTCLCGLLPNLKVRYRLGREARTTADAIQALIPQGRFEKVYHENDPPGLIDGAPDVISLASDRHDIIIESRASILEDIMNALDDEKLKVIGVYGEGGVGKTTLLEEVEKKLRNEKILFHLIAKAKVSQTPDLKNIQDDIAYALSLNLNDVQSQVGRADRLSKKLQSDPMKKVLIILDDLWDKLDLKAVGIPSGDESRGCKLLLTSRFKDVLQQKMGASPIYHLKGLKDDEAFRLFEKTIGDKLKDDEELKAIAPQVVKKLAGLPLLIISVANTLKDSDVSAWRNALIKIDESNMETIVKLSYDHLKSEDAKSLFLLCGLMSGTIQVETLLGLGMGLGLFEGFNKTIQDARDRLNTVLDSLHSICLLQDRGDDKENVTIHDLYSEVVVSTPFRGQNSLMMNSNYGSWPKEKLEKCWAICLADVGSARLVELMSCRFPDLKILMLSQPVDMAWQPLIDGLGDCSRLDFTCMKELQALYLRSMHITGSHSSINILGNLRSLYFDRCRVEDVAILGKLKALQILSFARSTISTLPEGIGELTNLRSLNLSYCHMLKIIEPGALKRLINLEELRMKGSFDRWMGKGQMLSESRNARIAELKSLTKITFLEISVPHPTILLEEGDLPFGNLIRFWINIGNCHSREFEGLRTMMLKLEGCDGILLEKWVQQTLQKTQYLHLDGLRESKKNAHELCTQGFGQLKHLDITNSPSIKHIAYSSYGQPVTAFKILESLFLENLINLEKICNCPIVTECFSQLKVVRIEKCHRLKNLWFQSEMQRLVHLEEIKVRECDSMQAIITDDAGNVEVAVDYFELPNVRRLDLRKLPNMTSFCTGAQGAPIQVSLPRLESLVMVGLLGLEEILFSEPSFKYGNLKSLKIEKSKSTSKSILKLDWILKLPNLESLKIRSSPSAEVVFDMEEQLDIDDSPSLEYIANSSDSLPLIPFTQLESLHLENLINLEKIYDGPIAPECFSKLKAVTVRRCDRLKYLWCLSDMKRLVQLEEIIVRSCDSMQSIATHDAGEDIVSADYRVELPNVRRLVLHRLPNMTSFCTRAEITPEDTPIQVSFPRLESLVMGGLLDLEKILYGQPPLEYSNLKSIEIWESRSKSSFFKSDWILKLPNLETLDIGNSPSAEAVFDLGELKVTRDVEIPSRLMGLTIWESPNLRCMWKQDVKLRGISVFRSLKKLVIEKTGLAFLFPMSVAKCLRVITAIDVQDCPNMKAVIVDEEGRDEGIDDIIEFPLLERLSVRLCPIEKFFSYPHGNKEPVTTTSDSQDAYSDSFFDQKVTFPNIRSLAIEGLRCKELWNNQIPTDSFWKLEYLELTNCDNLQHIAPSHMWKRLQRCLEILKVNSCRSIEIIYEGDGMDAESSKLRKLVLHDLENLRHIWQSDGLPNIPFPNLRDIEAVRCSRLEMLFATFTAEFLGQIEELVVESCGDMELIAGHEKWEEAMGTTITFSKLTALRLFELPKFRSFLPEKHSLKFPDSEDFPSLRDLSIVSCGAEPNRDIDDWEIHHQQRRERWLWERRQRWGRRTVFANIE